MARTKTRRAKAKAAAPKDEQPFDAFEAVEVLPQEEQSKNVNKRYDRANALEYELPSDIEDDEEIDEEMAFTEEDKKQFAGIFGGGSEDGGSEDEDTGLLMDSDASEDEEFGEENVSDDDEEGSHEHEGGSASEEGNESDAERHRQMLAAVTGDSSRKRKRREVVVSEAYPESEANLNPLSTSAAGDGQGELQISDLIRGLGDSRKKLGLARKTLERLERRDMPMAAPLPGNVQARQERKAAYEVTKQDVTKWQPLVKANREAPTLAFSAPRGTATRPTTTAGLAAQFVPETDMEAEVAAMLRAAGAQDGQTVQQAEEQLALKALNAEESKERRDRLAKMRALLFYHELKAKRMKNIKSKEYRRQLNKAARRKAAKEGTADGHVRALKAAAEEAEFERAKERLTLKHKNTSKWARRALKRGVNVMDATTKEAMEEQLRLGMQLRQKVEQVNSSDSDSEGSTSASDDVRDDETAGSPTAAKPKKPVYTKTRAAALKILQDGNGNTETAEKGLFGLPFMKRATDRQRQAAEQDAEAVLRAVEAEVTGVPEDELGDEQEPGGRFSFGNGFTAAPDGDGNVGSGEDSGSDQHEDAEAKAERIGRLRRRGAAAAAIPSQPAADGAAAQPSLPASRSNGDAQPDTLSAAPKQAANAAQLSHNARQDRLFGGGSAAAAAAQRTASQSSADKPAADGVSIVPAISRSIMATLPATHTAPSKQPDPPDGTSQPAPGSPADNDPQPPASDAEMKAGPDAMQPIAGEQLSQRDLIAMAFAGDDVQADFEAQKVAEAEGELPKMEAPTMLPGWGSWANAGRMQRDAEVAARKIQQQKDAALAKRKDAKRANVVISEKWDRHAQKYTTTSVPFPFDGRDTYERAMAQPLGQDFNTNASFRNLTRPAVIKEQGLIIKPLKYRKGAAGGAADSAGSGGKQKKGKPQQQAKPPMVKVVAGGQMRR